MLKYLNAKLISRYTLDYNNHKIQLLKNRFAQ